MSKKKYHVSLTEAERDELTRLSKSQRHSERERKRARILLLADGAKEDGADKDAAIARQVKVAPLTVNRVRQRFAERGLHKNSATKSKKSASRAFSMERPKPFWWRPHAVRRPKARSAGACAF